MFGTPADPDYWHAVEDCLAGTVLDLRAPLRARLDYRHPIDLDEGVGLAEHWNDLSYSVAFIASDSVKAVACVESLEHELSS